MIVLSYAHTGLNKLGRVLRNNWLVVLVVFAFIAYTLLTFAAYWARTLDGKLQNFLLIGQMFGTPVQLARHGVEPVYYGPHQTGWDGQMYYYLSNDLWDKRHSSMVFDAPAYRWQRVGFALFVGLIAYVLQFGWVSPETYIITYFLLMVAAVTMGALIFKRLNASPILILVWALFAGAQITLFNGLPDAAADSFLIISLFAIWRRSYLLAVIPLTFSVLAREAYVVFPVFILAALLLERAWATWKITGPALTTRVKAMLRDLLQVRRYYGLIIPIFAFVFWQKWITHHFGVTPQSQAGGVVGTPFSAWWHFTTKGLEGKHPYLGNTHVAHLETGTLIWFAIIMVIVWVVSAWTVLRRKVEVRSEIRGFAAAVFALACTYTAFGGTVIEHYSGYMKAAALFFFAIPFLLAAAQFRWNWRWPVNGVVIAGLIYTNYYFLSERVYVYPMPTYEYTHLGSIKETKDLTCLGDYHAQLHVEKIQLRSMSGLQKLFGGQDEALITVKLTNTSQQTMVSTTGKHPVFMSYEWVDSNNAVVFSGWRTAILDPLLPGKSVDETLVVNIPHNSHNSTLKLSPVQENCAWYYQVDPQMNSSVPLMSQLTLDTPQFNPQSPAQYAQVTGQS